jgi:uncharacterized protein (DUF58 family)
MNILKEQQNELNGNGVFCSVRELSYEGQKVKGVNLHLRRMSHALRSGVKRSSVRGRGMEFFESRPYVAQDEIRNIDWKVSARLNQIFTKVFIEERDRPIYLVVDLSASMFFGSVNCFKSVLAARIAARLATAAINGGDHLGGFIFNEQGESNVALTGGQKALARFFGILSLATKKFDQRPVLNASSWQNFLKRIAVRLQTGAVIFLISDFLDINDGIRPNLFQLRKKADIFALSITDPLEKKLPQLGVVGMEYGSEKIIFDSNDAVLQEKYTNQYIAHENEVSSIFNAFNIPIIKFSTGNEPDDGLKRIFLGRW